MNDYVTATIKCKCNKLISLGKNDIKIQVSNYYKHLQAKGCDHMNNIKKAARDLKSTQQQQQQSITHAPPVVVPISNVRTSDTPVPVTPTSLAPTYSSQEQTSLAQIPGVSLAVIRTASQDASSIAVTQTKENGKRRLTSQSQQHSSKRSRV